MLVAFLRGLSWLPLPVLYGLIWPVYLLAFYVVGYRRKVSYDNIRRSFPDKSDQEVKRIQQRFYRQFVEIAVELVKSARMSKEAFARRVTVANPEAIEPYMASQQSMIFLAAHFCNWEWLLLAMSARFDLPVDAVYKPLHNEPFDRYITEIRSRFGAEPIPHHNAIMEIMKRRNDMRGFAMVADQPPLQKEEKVWLTFLNQDSAFQVGMEKMAQMVKYPVFFVGMRRIKRGFYEVHFEKLGEPPYKRGDHSVLQAYARAAERQIQQQPESWLWTNRRWKYKKSIYE